MGTRDYFPSELPDLDGPWDFDEFGQPVLLDQTPAPAHAGIPLGPLQLPQPHSVPLWERPMEDVIKAWASEDPDYSVERVLIRRPPPYLGPIFFLLKQQHKAIKTMQACQCFTTRIGLERVRRWPEVEAIRQVRKAAISVTDLTRDQRYKMEYQPPYTPLRHESIDLFYRADDPASIMNVCMTSTTARTVPDLANDLGLSTRLVAISFLFAGLSSSTTWVPPKFREVVAEEVMGMRGHLVNYLKHLSA